LAILVVLLLGVSATLYALLSHEPDAYARAEIPPGPEREAESGEFTEKAFSLVDQIQCEADWHAEFSEQQINSYLAEDFLRAPPFRLPADISEPRVVLRPGRLTFGFRYGTGELSTVVSLDAKIWLPRREPNLIAVEIEQLRAGAMPLAVKSLRQQIDEEARKLNIDVQWYRNDGNPVAILRLQADKREATQILRDLEIREGMIAFKGRTTDPEVKPLIALPATSAKPPASPTPMP
jgi:hypothetical protein